MKLLKGVPAESRTARFVCHICVADAEKVLIEASGALEGVITESEKGENGFGYDPIMFVPDMGKTAAELTADEKNAISHRGNAMAKLKPLLEKMLGVI